jgi:metal-dependent amidase/aminoacylase/carboxypeptidase family protein
MVNDESLTEEITGYIDELLGAGTTYEIPRMTGSEDFSVISEKVPSLLLWVGTGSEEEGYPYGVHNPKVTFNEDAIHKMAAIYSECAIRWLEKID